MKTRDSRKAGTDIGRRRFLASAGAAAAGMAASRTGVIRASEPSSRPNLLLIMTDQQHIDTIAAGGCKYAVTPALDRLFREGTAFEQSYCSSPVCSPSRSSIMTGRTPSETGVYKNGIRVRESIPNLGQWLSREGNYEAVYAGKWHLSRTYTFDIPGFQVLQSGIGGQGNLCDAAVSEACATYLRQRRSPRPFLMVASFMQPHDICEWLRLNQDNVDSLHYPQIAQQLPPLPPNFDIGNGEPEHILRTRSNNEPAKGNWSPLHWRYYLWSYYRHIEQVDAEIGRLLLALDESGLADDTVIAFTSDHGEGLARHQMVRKSSPYDEAAKVPLIFSGPRHLQAGRINRELPVSGLDLMPTFCGLAGIAAPADMSGISLLPVLTGKEAVKDRSVVTEIPGNIGRVIRSPQYKLVAYARDSAEQFFDMQRDPLERDNLIHSRDHAGAIKEQRIRLSAWEQRLKVAPGLPNADAWWRRA